MFEKLSSLVSGKLWKKSDNVRDTIEELIEEDDEGEQSSLASEEKKLLSNVIGLHELTADDVEVPRAEIVALSVDTPFAEACKVFLETEFARLPVYEETLDNIIGFIHSRDLLKAAERPEALNLKQLCREVLFVAPSMRLLDLLLHMRGTRVPLAIVIDEYGDVEGLVSVWDVVREVVGDMSLAYEEDNNLMTRLSDGSVLLSARMELEDFEDEFGAVLTEQERDEEDLDTVSGLVTFLAGRVPVRHEVIQHSSGIEFEVLEADPRKIIRLRVHKRNLNATPAAEDSTPDA